MSEFSQLVTKWFPFLSSWARSVEDSGDPFPKDPPRIAMPKVETPKFEFSVGDTKLTREEYALVNKLGEVWNEFLQLPDQHVADKPDFVDAMHSLQRIILYRSAYRQIRSQLVEEFEPQPAKPPRR